MKGSLMSPLFPAELDYLHQAARVYGPAWRYWARPDRIQTHGQAWRELALIHEQICQREDGPTLTRWLTTPLSASRDRDEQRQLRGLLRLLSELGREGVAPFNAPRLAPLLLLRDDAASETRKSRAAGDAPTLPTRLRYLLQHAKALGIHPRWTAVARYIDEIDESRFNALCATAHHMHERGDDKILRHWLHQSTGPISREAAVARGLLHILDALEIF